MKPWHQCQKVALRMSQVIIWVSQMATLLTNSEEQPLAVHAPAKLLPLNSDCTIVTKSQVNDEDSLPHTRLYSPRHTLLLLDL